MKIIIALFLLTGLATFSACSQNIKKESKDNHSKVIIGGGCENCAGVYESPVLFDKLSWIDTLPDFNETGPKMMISGVIYQPDGKTPAKDVILFIYHTDQTGHYSNKYNEKGWARQQGYIRGWMKTNEKGQYKFYTLLPASYPNSTIFKHIHPTIKEPGKNEYWIDEFIFDDDPFLTAEKRKELQQRGGDGILKLKNENGILTGERNIYLGKNIPDYPTGSNNKIQSGLAIGTSCPAFDPLHFSGADRGTKACPMCKYGKGQGVMVWFNHTNLNQMKSFIGSLESAMQNRGESNFRVFLMYMNPTYNINDATGQQILRVKIQKWADEQHLQKVALLWIPSPVDPATCGKYMINPEAINTVFVYKKRKVVAKWINIDYTENTVKAILEKVDDPNI